MIAEVYPLKRQSRRLRVFDYLVPEGVNLSCGDLIEVPYRNETLWGIVKRLKDKPERGIKLKTIKARYEGLALREDELSFFEWLADDLAVSASTVLYCAIQHPPKRSEEAEVQSVSNLPVMLPRSEAEHIGQIVRLMHGRNKLFIQSPDIRRSTALIMGYLQSQENHKVLILAPTVRDVDLIRTHITGFDTCVITGDESPTQRFRRWEHFRASPTGIMIGTRAALLMIDSKITSIFIVRSGDSNFKQTDRNPRFDARSLAWTIHKRFGANIFLFDNAPTSNVLDRFDESEILLWNSNAQTQVVDIKQERDRETMCYQTLEAISEVLNQGGRVLCAHNQKGVSRLLMCKSCAHRWLCPACETSLAVFPNRLECARCHQALPLPLHCPSCRGRDFSRVGPGNQEIAQELSRHFPNTSVRIVDKEHATSSDASIVVATNFYLETIYDPFSPERFNLIVATNIDMPIYSSEPSALTSLVRDVWQWRFVAYSSRSPFIIQTSSPELLTSVLNDPISLATEEQTSRRDYRLPPTVRWARVTITEPEDHKAQVALELLQKTLTTIPGIVLGKKQTQSCKGAILEIGISNERFHELGAIFSQLPDRYIIDTTLYS
jgi:primosomal protein N'